MEIHPPLSHLKQQLVLGSKHVTDELRDVLTKQPGKMFHTDEMSAWGMISSEVMRTADKTRLRRLAQSIAMILDGCGYNMQVEDNLG